MRRFKAVISILFVCGALTACSTEDPNPELKDPIYKDLVTRRDQHAKSYEEAKAEIEALSEQLKKAEPHTIELKNIQRDLASAQDRSLQHEQNHRFYRIRADRRRVTGRAEYRRSFHKGEEWPRPSEYSDYLLNIRLKEANLNWGARVPRLQDRLKAEN